MSKRVKITMLSGLQSIILIFGLMDTVFAQSDDIPKKVQEIFAKEQLYDGQYLDDMLLLGPEVVPYLCEQIRAGTEPLHTFEVLAEFPSSEALEPVLNHLVMLKENSMLEKSGLGAINALKEIGDSRAEKVLIEIVNNESLTRELRFFANVAVARLGSPEHKRKAWKDILQIYTTQENVSHNYSPDSDVILSQNVYLGLCEILTIESDEALSSFLEGARYRYGIHPVMKVLGNRQETKLRPKIIEALLSAAEDDSEDAEYLIRLEALLALYELGDTVPLERLNSIVESIYDQFGIRTEMNHKRNSVISKWTTPFAYVNESILTDMTQAIQNDSNSIIVTNEDSDAAVSRVSITSSQSSNQAHVPVEDSLPATSEVSTTKSSTDKFSNSDNRFIHYAMLACAFLITFILVARKYKRD